VDPGLADGEKLAELIRSLKPRLGVYGVLGNHEYYQGYDKSLALYKKLGIKLLHNEAVDAAGLRIIGFGDLMTEKLTEEEVKGILKKTRTHGVSILLSHQPLMLELMAENGDFIGFSGHTHKGQIFPFGVFTRAFYKYFYGLYRIKSSFFYVTSGCGTWGPPMRFLAPSEIPVITLVSGYF
jgi:hypothetical protein